MSTIQVSEVVAVNPSVLSAGGSALDVIGLILSTSTRVPVGTVASFPDANSVGDFFGLNSTEASAAGTYFEGFTGSNKLPGSVLFSQYNQAAVAAYLRGGAFGLTIAQMQALSGSLTVVMDGYSHVISSIALSSYNSFSAAAAGIQAAFTDPTEASFTASIGATFTGSQSGTNLTTTAVTGLISVGDLIAGTGVAVGTTIVSQTSGTPGGAGVYVTSASGTASSASCTASSNVLDVTVEGTPSLAVGQTLAGSGVAGTPLITAQLTGSAGGVGTYSISGAPQQIASEAMTAIATAPVVTYDSVSEAFIVTSGITGAPSSAAFATGTLAASLNLTQATGAVLSQGAAAATPAAFMNALVQVTTNWVTFMTAFDPDNGSGSTQKQAFAAWKNTQNNRYGYVCWDTDVTPTNTLPATGSLGYILTNNGDSGTCLLNGDPNSGWGAAAGITLAAFVCGAAASIDFTETDGRITFAFKGQAGLAATVTTGTIANNLAGPPQSAARGNGYNFYGAYGGASPNFLWFQRGFCTGPFNFFDSYINQIWLNNQFQVALANLMNNSKSIPYNVSGDSLIESALAAPIAAGLNFGAFSPGDITPAQATAVNTAAGANVSGALQTQGDYLQVQPASGPSRAARTTPPCTFWYLDRGSVQAITLASVALN